MAVAFTKSNLLGVNALRLFKRPGTFDSSRIQSIPRLFSTVHSSKPDQTNRRRPEIGQAESLIDIGTRQLFNEEHDIFRESVRRFFRDELAPHHDSWERRGYVDKEMFWGKLGAQGYLGIDVPADVGGVGGDFITSTIVIEEQVYQHFIGANVVAHNDLSMPYITMYGTQEQKKKHLPSMVSGDVVGAIAMTEPSAGSDLQGMKTYAKKSGDDWILNGNKVFITNCYLTDLAVVAAITDLESSKKAHAISLFLVEAGTPGFTKSKPIQKLGANLTDTGEFFFDDVRLPSSALLGGEEGLNNGFYMLMKQLPRERLMLGLCCQAMAETIFEVTRDYVRQRKAFGKTLSRLQTVQHRLAALKTNICFSRSFIDRGIQLYQDGDLDSATASMIKLSTSNMLCEVCNEGVQLHGGWGYMREYPVARAFCSARAFPIVGGANEIMKELIARDIVRDK